MLDLNQDLSDRKTLDERRADEAFWAGWFAFEYGKAHNPYMFMPERMSFEFGWRSARSHMPADGKVDEDGAVA